MEHETFLTSIRSAFQSQYTSAYRMLRQAIEICPEELWVAGGTRPFWRIAYHAMFYGDYYLQPTEHDGKPWEKHRSDAASLWLEEKPDSPEHQEAPYTREELLSYCDWCIEHVAPSLAVIDFEAAESGFHWYQVSKFEHQLGNLRHLQGHIGQLSELLMAKGIDLDWVGKNQ